MKQLIIFLMMFLSISPLSSQEFLISKLDEYLDTLVQNDRFMGVVSVSKDRKSVYSKAVGIANIESKKKTDQRSTYIIGSISKSFTAVLVFQAIDQGKLSLTTTLDKYFPAIENATSITID